MESVPTHRGRTPGESEGRGNGGKKVFKRRYATHRVVGANRGLKATATFNGRSATSDGLTKRCCKIPRRTGQTTAFTLLEVVLAIVIAVAILVVALFFYHQAANLRTQLLQEAERTGTIRLLLERMSADLRTVKSSDAEHFSGTPNSIRFVKWDLPPSLNIASNVAGMQGDLKVVQYFLVSGLDGTNLTSLGLNRSEGPLGSVPVMVQTNAALMIGTTNRLDAGPTNDFDIVGATNQAPELLTDAVRRLGFRFWDGAMWTNSWDNATPPKGVEITLSSEAEDLTSVGAAEGTNSITGEIFRRVVFIPAGRTEEASTNHFASGGFER